MTLSVTDARVAAHPLIARLAAQYGYPLHGTTDRAAITDQPGDLVLFLTAEPERVKEVLDVAVILPELVRAARYPLAAAVVLPDAAKALAPSLGITRWPALVFLRDGAYIGAIEQLRDWSDYCLDVARFAESEPRMPPAAPARHASPQEIRA